MFPLENEYKSLLHRNAHETYKAACTKYGNVTSMDSFMMPNSKSVMERFNLHLTTIKGSYNVFIY